MNQNITKGNSKEKQQSCQKTKSFMAYVYDIRRGNPAADFNLWSFKSVTFKSVTLLLF